MMKDYAKQLKELQIEIANKERKGKEIDDLEAERKELYLAITQLEKEKNKKERKVKKLEQPGVTKFVFSCFGTLDKKLSKEKVEATNTSKQYEEVCKRREDIEQELERLKEDISDINECRRKYKELMGEQKAYVMNTKPEVAAEISSMDDQIMICEKLIDKLNETISSGYNAMKYINKLIIASQKSVIGDMSDSFAELSNGENWANAELFNDAGIAENYERKNHKNHTSDNLKMLQSEIEVLQQKIIELEKVQHNFKETYEKNYEIENALGFLDEKYDEYHNEVTSVKQVDKVKEWLLSVNSKLMENRSNLSLKSDELKMKKEEILVKEE